MAGKGLEHRDLGAVKVRPAESKTVVPGHKGGSAQNSNQRGRMGNAVTRCTWKMRSMSWRGNLECGVLQQLNCFKSVSVVWQGMNGIHISSVSYTFLSYWLVCRHISEHSFKFFVFISEICSSGICRSFSVDIFFLCLCKSKDQPTTFHISWLNLYWDVYYIFLAWGKSHLSQAHRSFFCFLWKAVLSRLCFKDICSEMQA